MLDLLNKSKTQLQEPCNISGKPSQITKLHLRGKMHSSILQTVIANLIVVYMIIFLEFLF